MSVRMMIVRQMIAVMMTGVVIVCSLDCRNVGYCFALCVS